MPYKTEIREMRKKEEVVIGATCDACGKELEPVFASLPWGRGGPESALNITLSGGYGQYYDGEDIHLIFCPQCADKFMETFCLPFLRNYNDHS